MNKRVSGNFVIGKKCDSFIYILDERSVRGKNRIRVLYVYLEF